MIEKLLFTEANFAYTIARIALGAVMLPHGLQKLFGWFGGYGFSATVNFFSSQGIPSPVSVLVILAESFGALGLLLGFGTRVSALGIGLVMIGAAIYQRQNGFFMNWFGSQTGEGFEYHLLAIGISALLFLAGGGAWALDSVLLKRILP